MLRVLEGLVSRAVRTSFAVASCFRYLEHARPAFLTVAPRNGRSIAGALGTWVCETYGVKQAQEWLGHSDPATTLRHYVRLTTAARAKAVAGLDEVTRAALEHAEEKILEDARPVRDNVVTLASRRQ